MEKNKNHWLKILPGLTGIMLLLTGCSLPRRQHKSKHGAFYGTATEKTFVLGQEAYLKADYELAARKMGVYAAAYPQTQHGLEASYWQAMSLQELGEVSRARRILETLKSEAAANRKLQVLILRGLSKGYLLEGNYAQAENINRELLLSYPQECDRAEVLAVLVDCAGKRGNSQQAVRYLNELQNKYPQSPYLEKLQQRTVSRDRTGVDKTNLFAVQAGVFRDKARAMKLMRKLHRKKIKTLVISKNGFYIVKAGSFSSLLAARRQATRLKSLGFQAIVKP